MKVLITGAASGIGRIVARLAAERSAGLGQQAGLLLLDRDRERLENVAAELRGLGAQAFPFVVDLSDPVAPMQAVAEAERKLGGLDGIVSNAGIIHTAALKDLEFAEFDRMIAINTRATWLLGKAGHSLLSKSRGSLVATASMSAEHPTPPLGAYSTSKAALVMLVKQMALEWGPDGIRCNCVSPGPTMTEMTANVYANPEVKEGRARAIPLRRLGAPEDIANAILYLLSPAAAFVTGINLIVDGGLSTTLMPANRSGTGHS